jgi:carbonic anhydrase
VRVVHRPLGENVPIARRSVLLALPLAAASVAFAPAASATRPQQSPIALSRRTAVRRPDLPPIEVDYPDAVDVRVRYVSRDPADDPTGCGSRGREETIEAAVPAGAAAVVLDGVRYELRQFHFHTPAEHTIDGVRPPLEQHFVHAGPDGETLVIGYFLRGGGPGGTDVDAVLAQLPQFPRECGEEAEVPGVDLAAALPDDLTTFRYTGSLTSSPYTEPVRWNVLARKGRIADSTLDAFRSVFPEGDARELQPLAGREVWLRPQHR